jgi:type VII secretion system ESX-1 transmembrane protein EccB
MARQSTTRLHVSGYRFLLRRMEHALVRGDLRMLDDPLRAQSLSLIAGNVVALIVVAACGILAFLRPPGALGSAQIVMVRVTHLVSVSDLEGTWGGSEFPASVAGDVIGEFSRLLASKWQNGP